jgi:hypothetical protein
MLEAIALALVIVGLVGLINEGLEEGCAVKRDRAKAAAYAAREEMHRQAEEARAHRRATDPVIARYYAGQERRERLVRR